MAKTIKFYLTTWALLCFNVNAFAAAAAGAVAGGAEHLAEPKPWPVVVATTSDGLYLPIQRLGVGMDEDYHKMIELSHTLQLGVAKIDDERETSMAAIRKVKTDLEALRDNFSDESIQYWTLEMIKNLIGKGIAEARANSPVPAETSELLKDIADNILIASGFFPCEIKGGITREAHFILAEDYATKVQSLFEPDKKLRFFAERMQAAITIK